MLFLKKLFAVIATVLMMITALPVKAEETPLPESTETASESEKPTADNSENNTDVQVSDSSADDTAQGDASSAEPAETSDNTDPAGAEQAEAQDTQADADADVKQDFSSARLIIGTDNDSVIKDKGNLIGEYNGVYILQYKTAEEAEKAYQYYTDKVDFAEPDTLIVPADNTGAISSDTAISDTESGEEQTEKNNSLSKLDNLENSNMLTKLKNAISNPEQADIALIDTGAEGSNVIHSVSVIGSSTKDDNGHGTKMAEIIKENAPEAKVLSIKALKSDGSGSMSSVYSAMEYAIRQKVKVINLSLYGKASVESKLIEKSVEDAKDAGITVVGAAGNDNADASNYTPGNIDNAVIVGACDKDKHKIESSNYGDTVDCYVVADSTSEACAYISAVIASGRTVDNDPRIFRAQIGYSKTDSTRSETGGNEMMNIASSHYTVTCDSNGGTYADGSTSKTYTTSTAYALFSGNYEFINYDTMVPPAKNGYVFLGWSTNKNATDADQYQTIDSIFTDAENGYKVTGNVTYYAIFVDKITGTWGTCPWIIDSNYTMTINAGTGANLNKQGDAPWYTQRNLIKKVYISDNVIFPASVSYMFADLVNCTSIDISHANSSNLQAVSYMFQNCKKLVDVDIEGLDTSNVTNMRSMFYNCSSLKSLDISNWNTSNVTDMSGMLKGCSSLTALNVSGFNTSNVTDMSGMFEGCSSLTALNVSGFNTSNVTDMSGMFEGCSSLTALDVSGFNTSNVTNMNFMFEGCSSLTALDVSGFNTSNVTNMNYMFYGCSSLKSLDISNWKTQNVTTAYALFAKCKSLTELDTSNFDTSNMTMIEWMFEGCSSLTTLDVSGFNTSKVTNMLQMFEGCSSLTALNVSGFNTSNVTDMSGMFEGCSSLTALDVSGFNTSNVTDMSSMFNNCSSLSSINVSSWKTSRVGTGTGFGYPKGSMGQMFQNCRNLKSITVSNFDTSNVVGFSKMFSGCENLTTLDVSNFDTSKVGTGNSYDNYYGNSFEKMFYNCPNLASIKFGSKFTISSSVKSDNFVSQPALTVSGNVSNGNWGLGSETAGSPIKTASELAKYGATTGNLNGTWYAQAAKQYTLTYNGNGGTPSKTSQITYENNALGTLATASRTGYTFNGWYTAASGGTQVTSLTTCSGNQTVYAHWTSNTYTISYTLNGGTNNSSNPSSYNATSNVITLKAPTRTGYTFAGWTGSNGTTPQTSVTIPKGSTGNKSYTANWTANKYTVTCEDWFVDASNNRKVKLGSATKAYNYGSTANGSDWGADGSTHKYYTYYVYKSSTSAVVGTSGATVYRYFWAWTDLNIYSATGAQDYNTGTVSLSADGGKTWTDNLANESNTIQPWGTTYVIKNLVPKRTYEEYDHCTSNLTYSNGQWSYTPTAAGTVMGLYMRYKTYTLTYNAEGGTSSKASQTAKYASKWGTMATASRTGYTFSGWFDDTTYKTAITADTVCYGNKTAHAKWTNNGYTIHYDGNTNTGGSYKDQAMTYDVAANLNANKFTKAHYHFTGWNTKADGSGTKYTDGQSVKNLASSGTVTLYAQWAIDIHYVDLQDGDISAYGTADVYINGKQVANDVADYYTKWPYGTKWEIKDIKTKTGITYDSATPGLSGTVGDEDSTINLHFHTNTYQVQFSANGGSNTMTNQQFTYGTAQNLTANAFTRAGYTFGGWVCQNKSYTDKQSVSNLTAVDKAVVTMVAQWKANTNTPYKVVHQQEQLNGTYTTVETQNLTGTTDSTVKPAAKAYTGFTSPAVQTVTIKGDGGTVVTYKYTRQKHTITRQYRLQNADGSYGAYTRIDSASYKYGATIPAWSRAADTEYNAASIAAYTVGTSDKSLSADVARHSGHLVINANGGSASRTTSVIYYGGADSINPMPTRTGYTLTGLYTEDGSVKVVNADGTAANDGTYSADGKWLLTSDVKVIAHWTPVVYSISYSLNGGAVSGNPASYTVETADIALKNPSRTGYTFTGWVEAVKPSFWKSGWIDINTGAITAPSSDYPDSMYSEPILLKAGNTYNVSGFGSYSAGDVRLRYFKTDGAYDGNEVGTKATSADHDRFVRIMYILKTTEDQRSSTVVTNAAKLSSVKITKGSTGNRSYTAGWSVHTGTITYNANGGSIGTTTLKGLSIASDGTVQLNGSALHIVNKHVSGKSGQSPAVEYDSKYDLLNAQSTTYLSLARTGYHFTSNEWNTKADGTGTAFNSDAEYNGQTLIPDLDTKTNVNRVVYADWKVNTYSIKFNANNGTGTMADEGMVYDTAKALTANSFKRTGYTFTGWNTKADGTGTKYSDKQSVNNLTAVNGGVVTLYAQWKADIYTITYVLNGGTNDKSNPSAYTVESADITLKDPARTGYAFNGWKEGKTISKGSTGNKTFTAQWTAHKLTIIYDANGGTNTNGKAMPFTVILPYDQDYNAKNGLGNVVNGLFNMYKTGYHIINKEAWLIGSKTSAKAADEDKGLAKSQDVADYLGYPINEKDQTVTLYANWKANAYLVKFDANGGEGTMSDEAMAYDTAKTLNENSFKRAGYRFSGWNTQQDGTGKTYSDKQSVSNLISTNNGTVTLYAKWTINTYTITYNLKGGINSSKNPSTYTVDDAVTLSNPAKDGYAFVGWAEGSQIAKGSTGDKIFTAKWKPIIKVSFTDGTSPIKGASAVIVDAVTGNTVDSWTTDGTVHSFNAEPSHAYTIRMTSANHYYAVTSVTAPAETDTVPMDEVIVTASQVPALPSTGGSGTTMMLVIACVGMIVSIIAHSKAKAS